MNDTTSKLSLAAALLLAVTSAHAYAVGTMRALEQVDDEEAPLARVHAAAPKSAVQAKAESEAAPAPAPSAVPAAAATPKADQTPAPQRTHQDPWAGLANNGPVPMYNNPTGCLLPSDPWYQYEPGNRCPPDYMPGQQPLACGKFATMVHLADSVICVSNGVGINQLENAEISAADRAEAVDYLKARGLAPSAALYAANAMNGKNLQSFTCMKEGFVNNTPMQAYGQIEWNLIFFSYVYGPLKGQALTQGVPQTLPAFCSKNYTM